MTFSIAFDATPYDSDNMTGAGRYVVNILRELADLDKENGYHIFGFEKYIPFQENWPSNFEYTQLKLKAMLGPFGREWARLQHVGKEIKKGAINLVQSNLDPILVLDSDVKTVCMIYDVMRNSQAFLEQTPQSIRTRIRTWLRYSLAVKTDHILTISEFSKKEINKRLGVSEDKITVTYLAVDSKYKPGKPNSDMLHELGINGPYCLFVGQFGRQKNENGLIHSFLAALNSEEIEDNALLVMVGKTENLTPVIQRFLRDHPFQKNILFVGNVDEDRLVNLYRGARLFVLPSFIEGFGLPVLEAMACGVPVVVSNTSSLPEVVGQSGLVISPDTQDGIRKAIVRLWNQPDERKRLAQLGISRAKSFSFKRAAEQTLNLYKTLSGR